MPTPLVMLGPGGDYTTQLRVKGTRLQKHRGLAAHQGHADAESDGGSAGYGRRPGPTPVPAPAAGVSASPFPAEAATYHPTDRGGAALRSALPGWLELQAIALTELADAHRQTEASLREIETSAENKIPAFVLKLRSARDRVRAEPDRLPEPAVAPLAADFRHAPSAPGPRTLRPQTSRPRTPPHEPHPQAAGHPQPHPRNTPDPRLFADHAGARRRAGRLQGHRLRARRSPDQKRRPAPAGQQSALFGSLA